MLSPGSQFHSEELPALLERARMANTIFRELQNERRVWLREAEKRIASVNARGAKDFRRGYDSVEGTSHIYESYLAQIENLVEFLIEKKGRYHFTAKGPVFDLQEEADTYNKTLNNLESMEKEINTGYIKQPVFLK